MKKSKEIDRKEKLRFIFEEKAKQTKSQVTIYQSIERYNKYQEWKAQEGENKEEKDEEYEAIYGLENEDMQSLKQKIERSKKKKGRGLLISFYEFNQEKRIPKLIRAMRLGLRVGLVSDAGTPTISDPGHQFVAEARKAGIPAQSIPGPCSITTALSASGFVADTYVFKGYLAKTQRDLEH